MTEPNQFVVHRDWTRQYPVISYAEGIYLYDTNGKRYIDGAGGSAVVVTVGHGVREVTDAIQQQAERVSLCPTHAFTSQVSLEMGELVAEFAPGDMRNACKIFFSSTGSEATDDAVRLARQYFLETGHPSKYLVIGRWQGFHGNTISAAGFSGHTGRRRPFLPLFVNSPHIPPAYCYRCPFGLSRPNCGILCARALEREIRQQGPENVAAFIAEPVVGAALGAVPAPDEYFTIVRDICDRYDVLFIADEVMTAWGRTGRMFGIEHWGVTPDIIATAKGIASGYAPLAGVIARDKLWEPLREKGIPFMAGHTFNQNPVSCAAGLAVIRYLVEHDLVEAAREQGQYFLGRLEELLQHDIVGDVRGRGLMLGFELVRDKETQEPFPPEWRVSCLVEEAAFKRGLVIYHCTGSVDGAMGDMILLAPPLIITRAQIDDCMAILHDAIREVEGQLIRTSPG